MSVALTAMMSVSPRAVGLRTILTEYTLASWTEADGLPASQIWAIIQDRDGYLWLGTSAGLVRFDGVSFRHWATLYDSPLPNISVRALAASRDGSVWIGFSSAGGVSRFQNRRLTNYLPNEGPPSGVVSAILEDSSGAIWVSASGGLSRFVNDRWETIGLPDGTPVRGVVALYEDRFNNLWLSASGGTFRRPAGAATFQPVPSPRRTDAYTNDALFITGEHPGTLDDSGLLPEGSGENTVSWRTLNDRRGNTWVATLGQGLIRLQEGTTNQPGQHLTESNGLPSNVVRSLFEDREGNIWIGTQNGLSRLSRNVVMSIPAYGDQRMSRSMRAMTVADDGRVWIGTGEGVYRFTGDSLQYDIPRALSGVTVSALHNDRHGTIWVATNNGIAQFINGRLKPLAVPNSKDLRDVSLIASDGDGGVWFGAADRVYRWKDDFLHGFGDVAAVTGKRPKSILADRRNRVWIGFYDGTLAVYDNGQFQQYSEKEGLAGGTISALYEDGNGYVWVGTTYGLSRFKNGGFDTVTKRSDLPGHIVQAIVEDHEKHLWLGINSGIVRIESGEFDKAVADRSHRLKYSLYDIFDGVGGNPFSRGYPSVVRAGDGTLWFFTSNGLAIINPRQLEKHRLPPMVRIEAVSVDDRELALTSELSLPPQTGRLQIDYTALSLTVPIKVRFRYLLEGFDSDWVEAGTRRQAFYTNLPPGRYRFQVIANNDGIWSEHPATWDFSIHPAVYQTAWFRALSVMIVALAVWSAWRLRVSHVRTQLSLVSNERARLAREIHDTLLQGLVGLSLQYHALSTEVETAPHLAKDRCERLREKIEMYIREARQSIWDLRSPLVEPEDFARALRQAGEIVTAGKAAHFEFIVRGTPPVRNARIQENLLRIGKEAINNAVRHASATNVHVELAYDDDSVTLRVTDNGSGFDPDDPSFSNEDHWGLNSMQERAHEIGGQLKLQTKPGGGTEVEVFAPLIKT
jgi:ligand-binding sensor domain-containing protein/signal transduction histidine kinase